MASKGQKYRSYSEDLKLLAISILLTLYIANIWHRAMTRIMKSKASKTIGKENING